MEVISCKVNVWEQLQTSLSPTHFPWATLTSKVCIVPFSVSGLSLGATANAFLPLLWAFLFSLHWKRKHFFLIYCSSVNTNYHSNIWHLIEHHLLLMLQWWLSISLFLPDTFGLARMKFWSSKNINIKLSCLLNLKFCDEHYLGKRCTKQAVAI